MELVVGYKVFFNVLLQLIFEEGQLLGLQNV